MASKLRLKTAEFVLWVLVVAALVVAVTGAVGFVVGDGLLGAKYALFVVGFLLFGVGSLAMQPTSARAGDEVLSKMADEESTDGDPGGRNLAIRDPLEAVNRTVSFEDRESRVDALVQRVPPLDDANLPVDERVGYGVKLFAVSLVVLAVSMWLEFGLGVRV